MHCAVFFIFLSSYQRPVAQLLRQSPVVSFSDMDYYLALGHILFMIGYSFYSDTFRLWFKCEYFFSNGKR